MIMSGPELLINNCCASHETARSAPEKAAKDGVLCIASGLFCAPLQPSARMHTLFAVNLGITSNSHINHIFIKKTGWSAQVRTKYAMRTRYAGEIEHLDAFVVDKFVA
jgi:hypothetical protein